MSEHTDNYAIMLGRARQLFLTFDQPAMCARLGLAATDEAIPVRFLGGDCRVRRSDGAVCAPDGSPAAFGAAMAVYDALARGNAPTLSGEFVPTSALHGIRGTHAVHENLHSPAAQRFAGRSDALAQALQRLGGRPWAGPGDVARVLDVFDFFPVCVRFWDADEEFPASLQFLWDANALDFLYYETLWYVMDEVLERIEAKSAEDGADKRG